MSVIINNFKEVIFDCYMLPAMPSDPAVYPIVYLIMTHTGWPYSAKRCLNAKKG